MCTLAIYLRCAPSRPLVVAANRDELLLRPTAEPRAVAAAPWIVAGQDLTAGGTWLGLNEHGLVAGLLNRRNEEGPDPSRRSRGLLCFEALQAGTLAAALDLVRTNAVASDYNPFNLLLADSAAAYVLSNDGKRIRQTQLTPGVHLLTNLDVDDPTCPRIARSFQQFAGVSVGDYEDDRDLVCALGSILSSHELLLDPRRPDLPNTLCVHSEVYGTRSSTIITMGGEGRPGYWHANGPPCRSEFRSVPLP